MRNHRQSQKENNQKLIAIMKKWRRIEEESINSITAINQKTKNPLVKKVLRIIKHDSDMHRRVQQFIIDSFEKAAVTLTPEELSGIWTAIEKHIAMERATIRLGQQAKEVSNNFIHRYLINYMLADERKHDNMLEQLENIKKGIYPYA